MRSHTVGMCLCWRLCFFSTLNSLYRRPNNIQIHHKQQNANNRPKREGEREKNVRCHENEGIHTHRIKTLLYYERTKRLFLTRTACTGARLDY